MIKFPSIRQFKDVIRNVRTTVSSDHAKLSYTGTVKMHGTNSSVSQMPDGTINIQSRNNIITAEDDNYNFAKFATQNMCQDAESCTNYWLRVFAGIRVSQKIDSYKAVTIYGEWCGSGINHGTGLQQLPRMFVIFAIRVGEQHLEGESRDPSNYWLTPSQVKSIPSSLFYIDGKEGSVKVAYDFPHFEMDIDFSNPVVVQNRLIELTLQVEDECPIAKSMGVSGVGEGIVWRPNNAEFSSSKFWFKVKGEKHSVSKVKTLAPIDPEKLSSIQSFVDYSVTERRLEQGIEYLKEMKLDISSKSTGSFIKWIVSDIMKEETDSAEASGLKAVDLVKPISAAARDWFFKYCDRDL